MCIDYVLRLRMFSLAASTPIIGYTHNVCVCAADAEETMDSYFVLL